VLSKIHAEHTELTVIHKHPDYFVHFLGWFEDKEFVFIAMGYTECGDLGKYIKDSWPKARREVREITRQLLVGLAVLHRENICHRDLKPQVWHH
jgi:serine/threonine protein kinase